MIPSQEERLIQKLAIKRVEKVSEPEPSIVEITVVLADDSIATLHLTAFELQKLWAAIKPFVSA